MMEKEQAQRQEQREQAKAAEETVEKGAAGEGAHEELTLEEELEKLRAEVAELKDKYLRALSQQENMRRRFMREKEDAIKYASSEFARDMLNVCDNLSRAIESVPEERKQEHELLTSLLEGVEMTLKEMLNIFERHHIRRIPAHGERFNPNVHEAMFEVEAAPEEAGKVVQVIQEGYTHHDRVLRPARVGVAKSGGATEAGDKGGDGGKGEQG